MGATWTLWVCTCVATWPQRLMGELAWRCALLLGRAAPINAHSGSETWPAHSFLSRISSQGCQPPANTSSHSNGTYKGLWALTGMSVACVSGNPGLLPLTLSYPRLLVPSRQQSFLPGLEVRKSLTRVMAKPSSRNGPPNHQSIHPPIPKRARMCTLGLNVGEGGY